MSERPLAGRGALVTGVSRRVGIGYAIVRRLRELGADVYLHGFEPHDGEAVKTASRAPRGRSPQEGKPHDGEAVKTASRAPRGRSPQEGKPHDEGQPWGADPDGVAALATELGAIAHGEHDFADPDAPAACVEDAAAALGHVDILVANHAMSCDQDLEQLEAAAIDATLAINVRASLLLTKELAARHDDSRPGGRVILFTSGQNLEPMTRELPYAASKGALYAITASLAAHLAPRGILVNAINPGPTDTGWATPELTRHEMRRLPLGRWGSPEDAARLVGWLATDDAAWITGQVLTSDGGFSITRG